MKKRHTLGYTISAVATRFKVHPQTLRLYEREGLLKPSRSQGNTRLYLEEDLQRLEIILNLTRDLRVNLAGVEVILGMRGRMETLQREFNDLFHYVQRRLGQDEALLRKKLRSALVPLPPVQITRLRPVKD
ncbi:MAG: MerR family transcriptional regulator [Acidobacteria bacterium]|nr:MerR family transcriptional regulator [Acidobacteriota bacterium]